MGAAAVGLACLVATVVLGRDGPSDSAEHRAGHVHALGVDPRDDSLFIASHSGLFRVARGDGTPSRVGTRQQDTMGFSVAGPNRFLASGHPDLRDRLPSRLGLVESRDEGKSWKPVSLLGRADFHVLRARGKCVVGYDSASGNIFTSGDGGQRWKEHRFEGPLVDLVMSPGAGRALLATSPVQLLLSRDGGRSWGALSETTGLLAWPQPEQLYLLASDGRLWISPDLGRRWRGLSNIGGRPAAIAAPGGRIYVSLRNGVIKRSMDGGRSWQMITRLDGHTPN
jgi:photosystem II stability/assembly factor-like uncharacterized protein